MLPRSPVSLSSGDEVPHIFTRKSRLQLGELLITSAKRLLQHNLPEADICSAANCHAEKVGGDVLPAHPWRQDNAYPGGGARLIP